MRVETTNVPALARVLDQMQVSFKVISDDQVDVYAKLNISHLTMALANEGAEILSVQERDESLESFYISLVGGSSHA